MNFPRLCVCLCAWLLPGVHVRMEPEIRFAGVWVSVSVLSALTLSAHVLVQFAYRSESRSPRLEPLGYA